MSSSAEKSAAGERATAPYGSWKSPITADIVAAGNKSLGGSAVAGDGRLLWIETRPQEGGRAVLVKESDKLGGKPLDVIPVEFAAQSLVQDYGGGSFAVSGDLVIFSNDTDQRLYKLFIGDCSPVPLSLDYGGPIVRFADGVFNPHFNRYVTLMEDHRQSSLNPTTTIVAININSGNIQEPRELVSGNDFYAFPRIDSNGKRMSWIEWSDPNIIWDKSQLWVGYFNDSGDLFKRVCVAGGDQTLVESPTEPKWSPQGELFFITDRKSGFWNIYKWNELGNEVVAVYSLNAEFTRPLWSLGISSYDFAGKDGENHNIICSYRKEGKSYLGLLDHVLGSVLPLDTPFTYISNITSASGCFYVEGASASHPLSIAKMILDENQSKVKEFSIIWVSSQEVTKYKSYFSVPELIYFPTEVPGQKAYAFFYQPSNPNYQATLDEKPPLLVQSHGGPTLEAYGVLDLNIQYWTSRGWAFVDVNYGGSSGYGREYRERLYGQWGIVDVNDCCNCARFLAESGKVDGQRLCITGSSAGGYTTLACLTFRNLFMAGASLYGVADLSLLRAEIHKFEACYIDSLVGDKKAYFNRSPINFVEKFDCPVILFQGLDDKIVLPSQARKIHTALKEKGLPVALVEFEGETHGFSKAENIKFVLEQQMVFFARLVGHFKVADDISPIKIDNLD